MGAKLVAEVATMLIGSMSQERHGRWRLNAGSEMVVTVNGLNVDKKGDSKPIRLVVDLATVKPKNEKVVALSDHDSTQVIGYWDKFDCLMSGTEADLHLIVPQGEAETAVMADAVRVAAMARAGVPVQVSVGAECGPNGSWESVAAGQTVTVNGRSYTGDADLPLYILRNGQIYESSVVTFGADSETGRVAAQKQPPVKLETPMSDKLKALLGKFAEKHHGLVARCVAENMDEPAITTKVHAAESDEKDEKLKAAQTRIAQLEDELKSVKASDYAQTGQEKQEKENMEKFNLAASKSSDKAVKFGNVEAKGKDDAATVETMSQAMKVVAAKDPTLTGFKLRKAARAAFPTAKEA